MVDIHVYGKLRRYALDSRASGDSIIRLAPEPGETLGSLLARLQIPAETVYTVFLNRTLLSTRNTMAPYLGYQQVRPDALHWDSSIPVKDGDRLGLFGEDMSALVV